MKKTEILKVRVDKETHTALMRHCQGNGQSPSSVLRKILGELIKESHGIRPKAASPQGEEDSSRYAYGLAAILIAGHLSLTRRAQQESPNRHHRIARLVDELLQTICGDEGQDPTPNFSGEMPGPALTALSAKPEPEYG